MIHNLSILQRRADKIPDFITARKEGKVAYSVLDIVVIKNSRLNEKCKHEYTVGMQVSKRTITRIQS